MAKDDCRMTYGKSLGKHRDIPLLKLQIMHGFPVPGS
jgi:hypothetical protein